MNLKRNKGKKPRVIIRALSSRTLILIVITLVLALLLLAGLSSHLKRVSEGRVKRGVTFMARDLGRLEEGEVYEIVRQLSSSLEREPVEAALDSQTGGVIPELYGRRVDVEKTVQALREAAPGEEVLPVMEDVFPVKALEDFPEAPLYRGNPAKDQVTFLVNVAWGNEYLEDMLDILEREEVKATFFFVGRWAERFPQEVQGILSRGHEAANHGYQDGVHLDRLPPGEIYQDIQRATQVIQEIAGQEVRYFSPHGGGLNPGILQAAAEQGLRTVMWSLDTVDWKLPGVQPMVEKVLQGAHPGATILMHPTEQTPAALEEIIPGLKGQGYQVVTLTGLLDPSLDPVN